MQGTELVLWVIPRLRHNLSLKGLIPSLLVKILLNPFISLTALSTSWILESDILTLLSSIHLFLNL